ncbi:MAG: site-specific DNA-methyltransferase [Muribaculaceae bacterium]|nr:site-specific DNA-methyltransferase [Muribaculaceae bacterium]
MDKLKMKSRDVVGGNVEKIAALFPHCVAERLNIDGKPELAIDFDKLRAELSNDSLEEGEERYQFTWPDKRAASRLANESVNFTLRPCREESVNFDTTENLYIEGDNLDVLKVLRETYLGRVKMIYIDPPYNTGNDFVYNDDFAQSREEFEVNSGILDEDGNQVLNPMQRNTEANGRFHTDWLNMIYPRLKVARDLLSDDGIIFISIDDNEAKNLKAVCDEIFGVQNFLAQVIWERSFSPINLMKHFSPSHDYILVYSKNMEMAQCFGIPRSEEADNRYSNPDNDPRGPWMSSDISVGPAIESNIYPITTPSGRVVEPPAARSWSLSRNAFRERLADNRIWFGPNGDGVPRMKRFRSELRKTGITPMTIWKHTEVDHSQAATQKLAKLFDGKKYFDYPKPVELIKRCLSLYTLGECIILDFFSGSATTAHAVMKLNAEDGGKRKFIMVQLPEMTDEKSEARKAGYANICEIGKERIRRAGQQIIANIRKEEAPFVNNDANLFHQEDSSVFATTKSDLPDVGFRVLKLDSSNMEDVFYTPDKFDPSLLDGMVDNIKADRSGEDLLFQVMLDLGIKLSAKIVRKIIAGKEVFSVDDDYLLACFDNDVNELTIEEMAKLLPTHLVIRDASAANDNVLDNFDQIIGSYSSEKKITTHIL